MITYYLVANVVLWILVAMQVGVSSVYTYRLVKLLNEKEEFKRFGKWLGGIFPAGIHSYHPQCPPELIQKFEQRCGQLRNLGCIILPLIFIVAILSRTS